MYRIIHVYSDIHIFERKVSTYLEKGWYLVGGPVIKDDHYYQAVAK